MLLVVNKMMLAHKDGAFVQKMHSFGLMHVLSVHSCVCIYPGNEMLRCLTMGLAEIKMDL